MAVFEATVEDKFKALECRVVESIQSAISTMGATSGWTTANAEFQRKQAAVRIGIQEMKEALEATSTDGLMQAAAKIVADCEAEKVHLDILPKHIVNRCDVTAQMLFARKGALEHSDPCDGGD